MAATFPVHDPTGRIIEVLSVYMPPEATLLVRPEIERIVGVQDPGALSLGLLFSVWVATSGSKAIIRAIDLPPAMLGTIIPRYPGRVRLER